MPGPSRNQPCPCGSGKKFKKCCGAGAAQIQAEQGFDVQQALETALNYQRVQNLQQAEYHYRQVLHAAPANINALNLLGVLYLQTHRYAEALPLVKKAVMLRPKIPEFQFNLGNIYLRTHCWKEAKSCFEKALRLRNGYHEAANHLGVVYKELGALDQAKTWYKKALSWLPNNTDALNNLGHALQAQGKTEEAMACYRQVLDLVPEAITTYQNMLMASNYSSVLDRETVFQLHLDFSKRFEHPLLSAVKTFGNLREPDKRLRVGYLSPDFRSHVVAQFIEPVLQQHDCENFELFGYYTHHIHDPTTTRLKQYFDSWKSVAASNDTEIAEMIHNDQIDILVDLAGHTSGNRILVFARRPAPIQVTWIGYPNTTGLSTMDYRITDAFCDPVGEADKYHSEKLIRLPECFSCFTMRDDCPDVSPAPYLENGYITFGSFNNLAKMTPVVLEVWAEILRQVSNSRLVLKYRGLDDASITATMRDLFNKHDVPMERVILLGQDATYTDHLQRYSAVDIALNPFPYNGTTTTCDALWMGVPVITLAGHCHASRVGVSQLCNLGLSDLVATSSSDYINIAKRLADTPGTLSELRGSMRQRMNASPLANAPRLTRNVEAAYREIWRNWCNSQ